MNKIQTKRMIDLYNLMINFPAEHIEEVLKNHGVELEWDYDAC